MLKPYKCQRPFSTFRSNGVRIKAPTIKEVLHFNSPEVENLCEPKTNEAKESESKRCGVYINTLYTLLQVLELTSLASLHSVCFFIYIYIELLQRNPVNCRKVKAIMTEVIYGSAPETVTCLTGDPVQVSLKQLL